MSFEKQMYEVDEKWEESYFSDQDRRRIQQVYEAIPTDAKSLLDVGCGNGILVNYLQASFANQFDRICATDRSKSSLNFVKTEKFEASIDKLPFIDGEFDIVVCLEVIEHLPQEVYKKALEEIHRIASKYVIISIPYKENLDITKVVCVKCKTEFSPFYHMHSFDDEKVTNLFYGKSLTLDKLIKIESSKRPYLPALKKWISNKINPNSFPPHCICPMCGYNELHRLKKTAKNIKAIETTTSQTKKTGLSKYWPHYKESKWIAGFFIKK